VTYTIDRTGEILTVLVTKLTEGEVPRVLDDIQRFVDRGDVSHIDVGFDEPAWQTAWGMDVLTSLTSNMGKLQIGVRVMGTHGRSEAAPRMTISERMRVAQAKSCPSCGSRNLTQHGRLIDGQMIREQTCPACGYTYLLPVRVPVGQPA
jgi:DNA-directed RNA polymerase subunit RPC12/RpoP